MSEKKTEAEEEQERTADRPPKIQPLDPMQHLEWIYFATPEEFAEMDRAAAAFSQHLANAQRELSTMKMFALATNERMVKAARRMADEKQPAENLLLTGGSK